MGSLSRVLCLRVVLISKILFIRASFMTTLARQSLCSRSSPLVSRNSSSLSSFPFPHVAGAHASTIDESNGQNSVIFRCNARRPIRACGKRSGEENEGKRTQYKSTERWRERERRRETHGTRGTTTYTASRQSIAYYTRARNVSRVLLKLLANDVGGVGWQLE